MGYTGNLSNLQLVALLIKTKSTSREHLVLAGNTHLHYHPAHEHIKVVQTALCLRHICAIRQQLAVDRRDTQVSIVFAGDLNSTPDGAALRLLTTGKIEATDPVWHQCGDNFIGTTVQIDGMELRNATGTPAYTNYSRYTTNDGSIGGFAGCLDYIFVGSDVRIERTIPMPADDMITKYVALPSKICPSDHLPIICDSTIVHY
jgi:mRNA deadenylase 3'-5' endonuclease subunit Ccr4